MVAKLILAVLALAASVHADLYCEKARYPWAGTANPQPEFPITQPASLQRYTKFLTGTLRITGSIKILDGCTFQMINVAADDAFQSAYLVWYGIRNGSSVGITFSEQTFYMPGNGSGSLAQGPIFDVGQVPGRQYSFYEIRSLALFSLLEQNVYATVDLTTAGGNFTPPAVGEAARSAAPLVTATARAPAVQSPVVPGATTAAPTGAATTGAAATPTATTTRSAAVAASSVSAIVYAIFAVACIALAL